MNPTRTMMTRGLQDKDRRNRHRIVAKALMPNLLCSRTAGSSGVSAVELTVPQLSDLTVRHGHGAENAGETKR
jgi:hypothetical protein